MAALRARQVRTITVSSFKAITGITLVAAYHTIGLPTAIVCHAAGILLPSGEKWRGVRRELSRIEHKVNGETRLCEGLTDLYRDTMQDLKTLELEAYQIREYAKAQPEEGLRVVIPTPKAEETVA